MGLQRTVLCHCMKPGPGAVCSFPGPPPPQGSRGCLELGWAPPFLDNSRHIGALLPSSHVAICYFSSIFEMLPEHL